MSGVSEANVAQDERLIESTSTENLKNPGSIDEDTYEDRLEDEDHRPDIQVDLNYDKYLLDKKARLELGPGQTRDNLEGMLTPDLITEKHTFTTYMSGRFSHIEFGTFFNLPACLIVMKFKFQSFRPSRGTRFKSGLIEVVFDSLKPSSTALNDAAGATDNTAQNSGDGSGHIQVLAYAPELVYGEVSQEHRKWHWDVALPMGYTDGALNAGVEPSWGYEKEYTQGNRAVVQGSETGSASNGIIWSLEESKISEKGIQGIPAIFTVACIVQHNSIPFQGSFKVDVRVGFTLDPMHWVPLTGKAKPCTFAPGHERIAPGHSKLGDANTGAFDVIDLSDLTTFNIS